MSQNAAHPHQPNTCPSTRLHDPDPHRRGDFEKKKGRKEGVPLSPFQPLRSAPSPSRLQKLNLPDPTPRRAKAVPSAGQDLQRAAIHPFGNKFRRPNVDDLIFHLRSMHSHIRVMNGNVGLVRMMG